MASEKFCLRWNDFETNISSAFKELREEKDFFDITLSCDDSQIQAHKVILSACSPFFRNVLRRNPHQHPLLYLKGVKYQDLISVLNFMYNGEVNVAQEELNSFLSVAEDLRVRGLTQENSSAVTQKSSRGQEAHPPERTLKKPPLPELTTAERDPSLVQSKRPRQIPFSTQPEKQYQSRFEDNDIQELVPVKAEPREAYPSQHHVERSNIEEHNIISEPMDASYNQSTVALDQSYTEDDTYGYEDYGEGYENTMMNTSVGGSDGNKGNVMLGELNEESDRKVREKMTREEGYWRCTDCNYYGEGKTKSESLNNLYRHVENNHVSVSFMCYICEKPCRTRGTLLNHRSKFHSQEKSRRQYF